jgi:hypothetical protein
MSWTWRRAVASKYLWTCSGLHCVTTYKNVCIRIAIVTASYPRKQISYILVYGQLMKFICRSCNNTGSSSECIVFKDTRISQQLIWKYREVISLEGMRTTSFMKQLVAQWRFVPRYLQLHQLSYLKLVVCILLRVLHIQTSVALDGNPEPELSYCYIFAQGPNCEASKYPLLHNDR